MTQLTTSSSPVQLTYSDVTSLAARHRVPVDDSVLMAINLYGIASTEPRHRARLMVYLTTSPATPWLIIVPLNALDSPFRMVESDLLLGETLIGRIERVDADEAVGGYFRNAGRAVTLNPNARSRCVGCAFCPNTLEAAADPRLSEDRELADLLDALREQHPRHDLQELEEVTVSTGCFEQEALAVRHLMDLRRVLERFEIPARIGFLTSVITSDEAFAGLARAVSPFVLRLTVECFERRDLLLKASKARLQPRQMPDILRRARAHGLDTSFTYIVGLDPLEDLRRGVAELIPHVTDFPNFQVYQAHNRVMGQIRAEGADELAFYLEARRVIEEIVGPTQLRPRAWEGYRPLWHFSFSDEKLVASA